MEKLIELLNECKFNSYRFHADWNNLIYQNETDAYGNVHITVLPDYKLISRQFWFIKRLVENNKINEGKIDSRLVRYIENHFDEDWYWVESSYEDYPIYERLLILLAIQDKPIDFLISILK